LPSAQPEKTCPTAFEEEETNLSDDSSASTLTTGVMLLSFLASLLR